MILEYKKDMGGKEILQDTTGAHQVMMEWERPYMIECINKLNPVGSVLEVGFGLGYSANAIVSHEKVTAYTVIECCPVVWKKVEEFKSEHPHLQINLIKGRWEDMLITLGSYDSIFFDDYSESKPARGRFEEFLKIVLKHNSSMGTRIAAYSTNRPVYNFKCITSEVHEYTIDIPSDCIYARGNTMYIPVITKVGEPVPDDFETITKPRTFDQDRNVIVIDNFLSNPDGVREVTLKETFSHDISIHTYATEGIKTDLEKYLSAPITKWDHCHNGRYESGTCNHTRAMRYHNDTTWTGILFLTPGAPTSSGVGLYHCKGGIVKNFDDIKFYNHEAYYSAHKRDITKWTQTDRIGNVYNRMVLFKSNRFHLDLEYFGTSLNDGRLVQVFYFS